MSYNNSTYIGIRKQVTQHLYKFFLSYLQALLAPKTVADRVHLKQPPINIRVVNCMKDRSPQRSPNLNVYVMLLIISALYQHDDTWIKRATLIY
jgi:hypothetical protein